MKSPKRYYKDDPEMSHVVVPLDVVDWPYQESGAEKVFEAQVEATKSQHAALVERETEREKAELAAEAAEQQAMRDLAKASADADNANLLHFSETLASFAISSVDRARAGAEVVQKASAAIATLYTGLLAFVFAVGENPLPTRGVLAPIFLGLAVVLSTAYIAYLGPVSGETPGPAPTEGLETAVMERLNASIRASSKTAVRRSWTLRASVLALGVGLSFVALPFITLGSPTQGGSTSTAADPPAWPTPQSGIPWTLNRILYTAQVQEIAEARQSALEDAALPGPSDEGLTLVLAGVGLFVVLAGATLWRPPAASASGRKKRPAGVLAIGALMGE